MLRTLMQTRLVQWLEAGQGTSFCSLGRCSSRIKVEGVKHSTDRAYYRLRVPYLTFANLSMDMPLRALAV